MGLQSSGGALDTVKLPDSIPAIGEIVTLHPQASEIYLAFAARVDSRKVEIVSRVAGDLEWILDEGESVVEGTLCARLSSPQVQRDYDETAKQYRHAQLAQRSQFVAGIEPKTKELTAKLEADRAQLGWLKKEAELADTLFEKGFISEHERYQAKSKYESTQRQLEQSERNAAIEIEKSKLDSVDVVATMASLKVRLADTKAKVESLTMSCPEDGNVEVGARVTVGYKVGEGETLLKIKPEKNPYSLQIEMSQTYRNLISTGKKVKIYNIPDEQRLNSIDGEISAIRSIKKGNRQEEMSGVKGGVTFEAIILPGPGFDIPQGELALVDIPVLHNGIVVPGEYLANDRKNYFVYIVSAGKDNVAQRRLVIATPLRDGYIVKSGVSSGDRLVPIPRNIRLRMSAPKYSSRSEGGDGDD